MKIKIMDDFVHEYEDVTQSEVYEVVEEYLMDYVIIDDEFDRNAILKEHCEIVTEEAVFKTGDRVKINDKNMDELIDWSIAHKVNSTGVVKESNEHDCLVLTEDDSKSWYVPKECLESIEGNAVHVDDDRGGEPTKQALPDALQQIIQFTQNNKGFSIEFDAGKITLADWSCDPNATFYRPKTLEELRDLMELLEKINEYRYDNE